MTGAGPRRLAGSAAPFVAARAVGAPAARALWLVLWASLAYFALLPANRAPQALHTMLAGMTGGEPAWLAAISQHGAALLAHQGLAASVGLAAILALIAVGVYLPPSAARAALAVAAVLAAVIWVAGQDLGGILTGSGTDPESGPLLILLVLAYWPVRTAREVRDVSGPSWLAGILAVIMIATAGYCASRLIIARAHRRRDERDVNLVHTVMGVAMAGMLVSWLNPLPDGVWAVMFGAGTGWFGWRAWRGGRQDRTDVSDSDPSPHRHHVPHLVMCGAMVYMLLAAGAVTSAARIPGWPWAARLRPAASRSSPWSSRSSWWAT